MTVIIALSHEKGVTIGSDSLSCQGNVIGLRDKRKWIPLGDGFWVASSGMADIGESLRLVAVGCDKPFDPFVFCSGLRERLRDVEHWETLKPEGGGAPEWGTSLLMTDGERVWATSNTLYPYLVEPGELLADGSGWAFAQGAMRLAALSSLSPGRVVLEGIRAAIHFDTHCGGEPWVETIHRE